MIKKMSEKISDTTFSLGQKGDLFFKHDIY